MIAVLIWVLAAVVLLLLLALVMPFRVEIQILKEEAVQFSAALRPFGRSGPRIALSNRKKAQPKQKHKATARRWKLKTRPKRMAQAVVRLARDLFACVRLERATIDLRFGLGDPAETGQCYGQMTPLIYGTAGMPRVHINVQPDFDQAVLSGRAALDVSLRPIQLLPPFVRFGWVAFGRAR